MLLGLFLVWGCATPEEAENQAANALEQLSDEELAQIEVESAKIDGNKAFAGQVIRLPSTASPSMQQASRALSRTNVNARAGLLQQERERRLGRQDEPCSATSECVSGLICIYDSVTRRNTCQTPRPIGTACGNDRECASSLCGRNQNNVQVCESPGQPFGNVCGREIECASNVCDITRRICLIPTGSPCENNLDCASVLCATPDENSRGRESRAVVCRERHATPNGGNCVTDFECRSGLCGYVDQNNMGVCEEMNSNEAGEACLKLSECRSHRCIIGEVLGSPYGSMDINYYLGHCA